MDKDRLIQLALESGADGAAIITTDKVTFYEDFRLICKSDACGNYGHCHMCPPEVGEISALISAAKKYSHMLVFQSIFQDVDPYSFSLTESFSKKHNLMAYDIVVKLREYTTDFIALGPGSCPLCKSCSARLGLPCRFPDKALASLESYGIDINEIVKLSGLTPEKPHTATFFGIILCNL